MLYKSGPYLEDIATLKKYSNNKYKITLHKVLRQNGYELEEDKIKSKSENEEKLACNISRARSKIFEYAYCNNWECFVNLTLDKRKYDRHNLKTFVSDLTQWLRDYKKKHEIDIKYLFIPEQHKDGAWHIHGLLMGLSDNHLEKFVPGIHPQKLIDEGYMNWPAYAAKFGYVSVGKIQNHEACSKYLTKYVSKDMATNNRDIGAHLYYCSKGLRIAEEIKRGTMCDDMIPDYENEYVKVKWLESLEDALQYFGESIITKKWRMVQTDEV